MRATGYRQQFDFGLKVDNRQQVDLGFKKGRCLGDPELNREMLWSLHSESPKEYIEF